MVRITRRDFLKWAAAASTGTILSGAQPLSRSMLNQKTNKPNIFILLFDAMSARHLSVYGYPRRTTPNLERFAQRAMVYHSHYSGGNFTTPGTSSILSGMVPWSNRAINLGGLIRRDFVGRNIFALMGNEYYRVAYSQNLWADLFLRQFNADIDHHISSSALKDSDTSANLFLGESTSPDSTMTFYAFDLFLPFGGIKPYKWTGSTSLGYIDNFFRAAQKTLRPGSAEYPFGLPFNGWYNFEIPTVLADVSDWIEQFSARNEPVLGYFHLWAPHEPLNPRQEFVGIFPETGILKKPKHPLSQYTVSAQEYVRLYDRYDSYIAEVDHEFGKLLDKLESTGALENSYFIVTSDHGQLFERGEKYHSTPLLYDPIIHTPLLISSPGGKTRQDIFAPTSAVDLLPTLLKIAGRPVPDWAEGRLLPGFGGQKDFSRSIFTVEAKENSAFQPLTEATISMIKGNWKLIYYKGYDNYNNIFELYNLHDDLQEMENLFKQNNEVAAALKAELLNALHLADQPFGG
jgi:arylsulfatase A-like enzyme